MFFVHHYKHIKKSSMTVMHYLSWATGDSHYVFGIEPWQCFRLLLVRKECIKVLQLIIAAPTVHFSVVCEG